MRGRDQDGRLLGRGQGTNEMTLLEHDELEQGVVPEGMEANDDD